MHTCCFSYMYVTCQLPAPIIFSLSCLMALSKYTLPVRKNILSAIFSCIVAYGIPGFEPKYLAQLINYRKSGSWNWKANGDQHSGRIKCSSSGPELSMHGLLLVCQAWYLPFLPSTGYSRGGYT